MGFREFCEDDQRPNGKKSGYSNKGKQKSRVNDRLSNIDISALDEEYFEDLNET
jgi:hypothetical protein